MKPNLLLLFYLLLATLPSFAQTGSDENLPKQRCGTAAPSSEWDAWFNSKVESYKINNTYARPATITIPVVVHVIHGNQTVGTFPNISQAQINSQIQVLNEDFAGVGFNSEKLAATGFSAVGVANTNINFCLAQSDPSGNMLAEPGIDRISYVAKGWTNPATPGSPSNFQTLLNGTIKPNSIWDPTRYFNIWVSDVNPSNYLLGNATFPAGATLNGLNSNVGSATTDGLWIWAKVFGNTGTLFAKYDKGRTTVHETAHWLGLRHIGGDASDPAGDCAATDYCNDTPPQKGGHATGSFGQNYGAPTYPLHPNVCGSPNGDMFMNFMDYTEDAILYMFTPDQAVRMRTALETGTFRSQLGTSSATLCTALPVSVEQIKNNSVLHRNIFLGPNPGDDLVKIILQVQSPEMSLVVLNTMGVEVERTVIPQNTGSFTLDVEKYAGGLYFFQFSDGRNIAVKRLVVAH